MDSCLLGLKRGPWHCRPSDEFVSRLVSIHELR